MKTTPLICLGTILLIGSLNTYAQPARPQMRSLTSMLTRNVTNTLAVIDTNNNKVIGHTTVVAPTQSLITTNSTTNIVNSHIVLNSGVILLNPFSLTTNGVPGDNTKKILQQNDGAQAKFFIDLAVNYVWAWDTERRARFAEELDGNEGGLFVWQEYCQSKNSHISVPIDIQTHISYYAKDSSEATASAIVGSGNFGAEVNVGFPIYRALFTVDGTVPKPTDGALHLTADQRNALYDNLTAAHWVGLVGSYSGVTDSSAFNIHNRYLLGLGYRAAYPAPVAVTEYARGREFVLSVTAGAAGIDTVQFVNGSSREIKLRHGDIPAYTTKAAFALEIEAYYPITSSLSAVMGSRLYTGTDPGVWNAYFGATIPLDKIADLLK